MHFDQQDYQAGKTLDPPPLKYMRCRSWRAENGWSYSQEESGLYAPRPEEYAMNVLMPSREDAASPAEARENT